MLVVFSDRSIRSVWLVPKVSRETYCPGREPLAQPIWSPQAPNLYDGIQFGMQCVATGGIMIERRSGPETT